MNKLELLRLAESQDVEAFEAEDFEDDVSKDKNQKFKEDYQDFYDDVKQSSKYIKEDW